MSATIFLARLLGLYLLAIAFAVLVRGAAIVAALLPLIDQPPLVMLLALIVLAAGLAIVLAHNRWSGGALTVVITVIGWITVIRGLLLLFFPEAVADIADAVGLQSIRYAAAVGPLALGAYLTYAGFTAKPPSSGSVRA